MSLSGSTNERESYCTARSTLGWSGAVLKSPLDIPGLYHLHNELIVLATNRAGDAALRLNDAKGPGPSAENPAGVNPKDIPAPGGMPGSGSPDRGGDARGVFSNPLEFKDTFKELSSAFTKAIHSVEDESRSGVGTVGKALLARLQDMRDEIDGWMMGKDVPGAEGGEQTDDVDRKESKATGLYKE